MQVSVCLGAILIPEYLDSILAILLQEQNSRNIFRNTFLFRNIPKRTRPKSNVLETVLSHLKPLGYAVSG